MIGVWLLGIFWGVMESSVFWVISLLGIVFFLLLFWFSCLGSGGFFPVVVLSCLVVFCFGSSFF